MVVLDDLGFADLGCYGSSISTPNIDGLARDGLRYTAFHATALCAPTRACLLTGRNHHAVNMGMLADSPTDAPGYTGRIPRAAGSLARILRDAGYGTFAVGKWHLAPRYEVSPAGPFDRWPLGLGFERYYGFLHGMTDQWLPDLVRDNSYLDPSEISQDPSYHLTTDLADQAMRIIQDQHQANPDKPFFLYFAPGAVHSPHQVDQDWIDGYRDDFNDGWDVERGRRFQRQREIGLLPASAQLTDRPSWVSDWESLTDEQRRLFARQMEVYAGFLSHTDQQIGRLLDFIAALGAFDNTIVLVLSDNGAAGGFSEGEFQIMSDDNDLATMLNRIDDLGTVEGCNHYATGWAWAGNTPLRLWKSYTWLGGVRVPLVVRWPAGISEESLGGVRTQFGHAVDLMPTLLEAAAVDLPEAIDGEPQMPLDGKSLLGTLTNSEAPSPRKVQYFEMLGSRSIYRDGWKATTDHVAGKDYMTEDEGSREFATDRWSLYHLDDDYAEANDLADVEPERLREMIELWWYEAGQNNVLPLTDTWLRPSASNQPPFPARSPVRDRYVCLPGGGPIETPRPFATDFTVQVEASVPEDQVAEGMLCAHYATFSGCRSPRPAWACYMLRGRLVLISNEVGGATRKACAQEDVVANPMQVVVKYRQESDGEATLELACNGETVARIAERDGSSTGAAWRDGLTGAFLLGRAQDAVPGDDYLTPFVFNGEIRQAVLEMTPTPSTGRTEEIENALRGD